MPAADIASTQLLIDTKIKGSSKTPDHYLFSPSGLKPEPNPGVLTELDSLVEDPEEAGD
jgi:hypothetical protein